MGMGDWGEEIWEGVYSLGASSVPMLENHCILRFMFPNMLNFYDSFLL